jgi:hypothetical protein
LPTTNLPTTTLKKEYYFPSEDVDSVDQDVKPEAAHVEQSVLSAKEVSGPYFNIPVLGSNTATHLMQF